MIDCVMHLMKIVAEHWGMPFIFHVVIAEPVTISGKLMAVSMGFPSDQKAININHD